MEERKVTSKEHLEGVLKSVTFEPALSQIDMRWKWPVRSATDYPISGWLVGTHFSRRDRNGGPTQIGKGREWFIAYGTTESGVVKTVFAAVKMILEHELMEAFHVSGVRIFDPHNTVAELTEVQVRKRKGPPRDTAVDALSVARTDAIDRLRIAGVADQLAAVELLDALATYFDARESVKR
jgi:hypothetical protein